MHCSRVCVKFASSVRSTIYIEWHSRVHSSVFRLQFFNIGVSSPVSFSANMSSRRAPRYFVNPYAHENKEETAQQSLNLGEVSARAKEDLQKIFDTIVKKEPAASANPEGGLYVGSAGIAYAFLHASELLSSDDANRNTARNYLSLAERYLAPSLRDLEKRGNRVDCSFLLGDGGVIAVAAILALKNGDIERSNKFAKRYVGMAELCKPVDFLKCGSDEMFVGRTGYLFGSLWLNKQFGRAVVPVDRMHELARSIITSGETYARKHNSPCPLMYAYYDTEYLGAAHGLAAILQVLIQVPEFFEKNERAEKLVRSCVEYFLTLESSSGNYPCSLDEATDAGGANSRGESNELVHWCHGAPGVVYLFAAALLRWQDPRYLDACKRAADLVWHKGLLKKGPGICHGVAGNGYVFLLLYRLTSDVRYLARARRFADFLNTSEFKRGARTPDNPYSLYEGVAGTACFLADLCQPCKAAFPFQDVFFTELSNSAM